MTDGQERAKVLDETLAKLRTIDTEFRCGINTPECRTILADALAEAEAEVWKRVIKKALDESRKYTGKDFPKGDVLSGFERWCREQALRAQGRGGPEVMSIRHEPYQLSFSNRLFCIACSADRARQRRWWMLSRWLKRDVEWPCKNIQPRSQQ